MDQLLRQVRDLLLQLAYLLTYFILFGGFERTRKRVFEPVCGLTRLKRSRTKALLIRSEINRLRELELVDLVQQLVERALHLLRLARGGLLLLGLARILALECFYLHFDLVQRVLRVVLVAHELRLAQLLTPDLLNAVDLRAQLHDELLQAAHALVFQQNPLHLPQLLHDVLRRADELLFLALDSRAAALLLRELRYRPVLLRIQPLRRLQLHLQHADLCLQDRYLRLQLRYPRLLAL